MTRPIPCTLGQSGALLFCNLHGSSSSSSSSSKLSHGVTWYEGTVP